MLVIIGRCIFSADYDSENTKIIRTCKFLQIIFSVVSRFIYHAFYIRLKIIFVKKLIMGQLYSNIQSIRLEIHNLFLK